MRQQFTDLFGFVRLHQADQLLGTRLGQLAEDICRLVGFHLLEDVRGALLGHLDQDVCRLVRVHFLEDIGDLRIIEFGQELGPLLVTQVLEDVGQIGRVQPREAIAGDLELDLALAPVQGFDHVPGDQALGDAELEKMAEGGHELRDAQATRESPRTDVHPDDDHLRAVAGELDIVDPDDLGPVDVHDLAVEHVLSQEPLALVGRGELRERDTGPQGHAIVIEAFDQFPGNQPAMTDARACDDALHVRQGPVLAQREISEPGQPAAGRIHHGQSLELAEEKHRSSRSPVYHPGKIGM